MGRPRKQQSTNGATLGFEATLWAAADKLRGHMDAAEYKHVVLGLIFLKYVSDAFEARRAQVEAEQAQGADPEHPDEYLAEGVFWVPAEARWSFLQEKAKQPEIGTLVDAAMDAIEGENRSLAGVLPKEYARPALDKQRLGELIDLIGNIGFGAGDGAKDVLGRVYEYFLGQFASKEGKRGGEFYTPRSVVKLLVEMIEPYQGRVYDPCCGSSGMFVQSEEFIAAHGGRPDDISIFGQESNPTTWKLAKMNLALRGIEANLGPQHADTFRRDLHPDLKADFILANPPFNDEDWGYSHVKDDPRWAFGPLPPGGLRKKDDGSTHRVDGGNANFAWVQHIISHMAPKGVAAFVLANGSTASMEAGEGTVRQNIIEAHLVDCVISLPDRLFYGTGIPASIWILSCDKTERISRRNTHREGTDESLFIDARGLGSMVTTTNRELSDSEVELIAGTYRAWRDQEGEYEDLAGFSRAVAIDDIRRDGYFLTPSRFVGLRISERQLEDGAVVLPQLIGQFEADLAHSRELDFAVLTALDRVATHG